jgi:membrane metallo-endopeptidase-like protein 1
VHSDGAVHPVNRKHFNEKAKLAMEEMVKDIRREFDNILNNIDWMDSKTKKRAKVGLQN